MKPGVAKIYLRAQFISRLLIFAAALLSALLSLFNFELGMTAQLVIALSALALGIPHGAIDHLVAMPTHSRLRFWSFIAIYVAFAAAAALFIATHERLGFQLVLVMSALHFGFGDASFYGEFNAFSGKANIKPLSSGIYALVGGAIPLVLPLTSAKTLSALQRINPKLENWAGGAGSSLRMVTLISAFGAILWFATHRAYAQLLDLSLLLALGLFATPLIAFAFYFGCWHALRHTARLVPKLPKAERFAETGETGRAVAAAVLPGLYALAGTLALALALMITSPDHFSSSLLWATLVLIWALTVPHMATTARFDLQTLKNR